MEKNKIKNILERWKRYYQISEVGDITRRYFVMNAFDGALTMLGVIIGAYMAGIFNPMPIISAGVAGSIAMGTSGISGAYMAEKAERTKKLKELEKAMLTDLTDGLHYRSHRFASIFAAIVDGVSPALAAMLVVSPFILVRFGILNTITAFYSSIILTMLSLLLLGLYLAKISDESMIKYGIQMLLVGFITAFLCFMTSFLLGGSFVV
ncbi:MAG: VIT1/CCC1 transporter family protein [Candidatus Thermoplasmatota archaeon]|nr:VIT1/CCC1 transporter family protein [Candidatus Thermoplasmatota archaeon]